MKGISRHHPQLRQDGAINIFEEKTGATGRPANAVKAPGLHQAPPPPTDRQTIVGRQSGPIRIHFLRRLIDKSTEAGPPHHHIYLKEDAKADTRWWPALHHHGRAPLQSLVIDPTWQPPPHFQLYTDAAGEAGFGAFQNGKWFNSKRGPESQQMSINWKELS